MKFDFELLRIDNILISEKGFCVRGDLCMFDHGADPVIVEKYNVPPYPPGRCFVLLLTLLHSERPKLYTILAFLSAVGLNDTSYIYCLFMNGTLS